MSVKEAKHKLESLSVKTDFTMDFDVLQEEDERPNSANPELFAAAQSEFILSGPAWANKVYPDQATPTGAVSSGYTLFANADSMRRNSWMG